VKLTSDVALQYFVVLQISK